jgi:hypothetical protein
LEGKILVHLHAGAVGNYPLRRLREAFVATPLPDD